MYLYFSLYKTEENGENIGIIVKNKHINGLEINLECVIIKYNYWFSVFNVCCGPRSIFNALRLASGINFDPGSQQTLNISNL